MAKQIFINLPVEDLNASMDFFKKLGFNFDQKFTNDKAACLVLGENLYSMLLTKEMFAGFTKKEIADSHKTTEVLIAIDVDSREAVDEMVNNAEDAGGKIYAEPQDHGWMYGHSFADLDGHQWEVLFIDPNKTPHV